MMFCIMWPKIEVVNGVISELRSTARWRQVDIIYSKVSRFQSYSKIPKFQHQADQTLFSRLSQNEIEKLLVQRKKNNSTELSGYSFHKMHSRNCSISPTSQILICFRFSRMCYRKSAFFSWAILGVSGMSADHTFGPLGVGHHAVPECCLWCIALPEKRPMSYTKSRKMWMWGLGGHFHCKFEEKSRPTAPQNHSVSFWISCF